MLESTLIVSPTEHQNRQANFVEMVGEEKISKVGQISSEK